MSFSVVKLYNELNEYSAEINQLESSKKAFFNVKLSLSSYDTHSLKDSLCMKLIK
jgi:hypothetical protein